MTEPQPSSTPTLPTRPFGVTLLALGVLTIASLNLARLLLAIREWAFIAEFPRGSPFYLAFTGLVWTVAGLSLAFGLWRGRRWALRLAWIAIPAFALYYWLDRLLMANRAVSLTNWPFAAVLTGLLLGFAVLTLARRKNREFFSPSQ